MTKKKIISFQGLHGAYSDLVCRKFYKSFKTLPCNTFEQTLAAVETKKADLALIPVENNIALTLIDVNLIIPTKSIFLVLSQ